MKQFYPIDDIFQLHHGNADKTILTCETIIFNAYVQLEKVQLFFVSNNTEINYVNCTKFD